MDFEKEGNIITARLDHGESLFGSLTDILQEVDKKSATVMTGIGMLKDFKLGYYDADEGEYSWERYEKPMELISLGGSITSGDDIHIHATLAKEDHSTVGGHLEEPTVFNVNEVTLLVFDEIVLSRKKDEERDMELLSMYKERSRWIHGESEVE